MAKNRLSYERELDYFELEETNGFFPVGSDDNYFDGETEDLGYSIREEQMRRQAALRAARKIF